MTMQTIRVDLSATGNAASYDIYVGAGLLARAGDYIASLLARPKVAIVTDETVAGLHLDALKASLGQNGITVSSLSLPAGEGSKSFAMLEKLTDWLLAEKIERDDIIIALGGGVIGDLTGFAAAILRRGVSFVQIPTTLLAQVDSSVGGKTAINAASGKNLIGAFHQPRLVLADTDVLNTLPQRDFLAGYAEVIKYAALGDADFFDWLESNLDGLLARDTALLQEAVARSCSAKAAIVAADEKEKGQRALLNLGHTFGHAYEALTGYGQDLLHGEGVALGMVMAYELSASLDLCPPEDAARLRRHIAAAGLPVDSFAIAGAPFDVAALTEAMAQDKKVRQGVMTFILVTGLGKAFISNDVTPEQLDGFLREREQPE